jgi:protease-4
MGDERRHSPRRLAWGAAVLAAIGIGIALGFIIPQYVFSRPKIGLITVPNVSFFGDTTAAISAMLTYALEQDDIKGVAIALESPGGGASTSEELFLQMVQLRSKKPVVVSAGSIAASGGYMMALGANWIYAKEGSILGNIGVVAGLVKPQLPSEDIIASGPFKQTGVPQQAWVQAIEILKESFVEKAVAQRGERLRLNRDQLADGRIYLGGEALKYGLIDEIGTVNDAIRKAAELAGVGQYKVVDINKALRVENLQSFSPFSRLKDPGSSSGYTQLFYLYVEPGR